MAPSTDSGGSSRPGLPGAGGGSREDSEFLSPSPPRVGRPPPAGGPGSWRPLCRAGPARGVAVLGGASGDWQPH